MADALGKSRIMGTQNHLPYRGYWSKNMPLQSDVDDALLDGPSGFTPTCAADFM